MIRVRVMLAVIAIACGFGVFDYLRALNVPAPAVLAVPVPSVTRSAGPARRVVWMLLDGLRLDTSRSLPALGKLRAAGFDAEGRAAFPTYSVPNYVAQACGLDPVDSGVRTNGFPPPVPLDSVFRRAKLAGLKVGAFGTDTPWFTKYFGPFIDDGRIGIEPSEPPPGDLALIHLDYTDEAGHESGASSEAYARAARRADEVIGKIAAQLDPKRDVLVVTSDHGHTAHGGHGGAEPGVTAIPIVFWGAGVPHGKASAVDGRDVGPTIAALLGIGPLGHALGKPLFADSAPAAAQRSIVTRALADEAAERDHRESRARALMLPIAVVLCVALFVLALLGRAGARGWLLAWVYLAVLVALYHLTDTVSFSSPNQQEPFMARFAGLASVAAVVQLVIGSRRSALPATFLASLPLAYALWLLPERPLVDLPSSPALTFFPVLAFGALTTMCGWAVFWARKGAPRER